MTVVNIFGSIVCARYDMLIVSEQSKEKVYSIIKLSVLICFGLSLIITILYIIYNIYIASNVSYNAIVFICIFIILVLAGITNILNSYNNRKRQYPLITKVNIIRAISKDLCSVTIGFIGLTNFGLLLSQVFGSLLGINKQVKSLRGSIKKIVAVNYKDMVKTAKENYRQPLYSTPAIFANNFSYSSINFFIESLYGISILGYYSFSFRVLGMPLSLISNNVSKIYFEEASRENEKCGSYKKAFLKTSIFLFILAIPMCIFLYYLSPAMFEWLFGKGWYEAGTYVKVLAPMFAIRFIVSALTPGMVISGKQKVELAIQVLFVVASICIYITSKTFSLNITEFLYNICYAFILIYIIYYYVMYKLSSIVKHK